SVSIHQTKSAGFLSRKWRLAHQSPAKSQRSLLLLTLPLFPDNIKLLGVTFQSDGEGRLSWEGTLRHVQAKLLSWSERPLSQTGKILVLKAIVLPIFLYLGRVFPPDKATSKIITRMAFRFVWGSTMEKLKRATLLKEERNGGRGVHIVVNILVQGLATLVQNTRKVEKASGPFARYYATPFLRTMGLCVLNLTIPYCWDPPYVYRALRDFAFGAGFPRAGLTSCSYKIIMAHLRSKETMTLPRGSTTLDPSIIWANVLNKCLSNKQKDIAWMSAHMCLPTR
ncbi:hypothetical protein SKAU_G00397640, partial [Synaphobranchus kaupii]